MTSESAAPVRGLGIRLMWFVVLWGSSVAVLGVVAFVLRLWIKA